MTVPPSKPDHFRVIIAGGGIAGLSLANALQHANIDYVLLEARSLIAPQVGASIGLAPNGSRILDQLGCYDDIRELTLPVVWVGDHYENGDYIYPKSNAIQLIGKRHAYEFCFLDRQLVLEVLYDHIIDKTKVLLNKRLASVDHGPWGVKVYCTDGTYYEGDILAGADGVYSPVRQEMWRVADNEEPGAIPVEDKTAMQTEYKCLFGISSPTPGLESVSLDVTYTKDFSTMVVTCKGDRVYFFLFKRLDKVYGADTVLKFSKEEAEQFGEQCRDVNLMPGGSVKFGDVWNNRMSFTLVALEEAEYKRWTWGRFVCLGDGIHKMTPNAAAGGNASIESAAALANSIRAMLVRSGPRPSLEAVENCLSTYQQSRIERTSAIMKMSNKVTRIQALKGWDDRLTAFYVAPYAGDYLVDMQSNLIVGAIILDYLPPPSRSLQATLPFNPDQGVGRRESLILRALKALPFLGLSALALTCMVITGAVPAVENMLRSSSITWDGGSIPIRSSFYHIGWLDDLWRPFTVVFAAWNLGIDQVAWWQGLTFLTDYGVLYSIFLVESARRANMLTLAQFPTLIGLAAQLLGIGVVGPVYFFIHYLCAQISNFQASDMRLTDLAYTRSILPVMVAGYYVPHFLSHLHPSLAARHDWTWIWQMFPVWVMLCQRLLAYTILPNTVQSDRINDPKRDVPVIRLTIGICVALSALVWLSTLAMSPYTPMTMFIPEATAADRDWTAVARNVLQYDQLFSFGSALLWLGYLFGDLKRAGMVQQSWIKMVMAAAATVLALGPGAAVGIAWMWREEILVSKRHKSAVVAVRDDSVLGAEKRENGTL